LYLHSQFSPKYNRISGCGKALSMIKNHAESGA
jgi:hypothetical protein